MRALGLPNEFDGEPTTALLTRLSGEYELLELHALREAKKPQRLLDALPGQEPGQYPRPTISGLAEPRSRRSRLLSFVNHRSMQPLRVFSAWLKP
jgi:hypothetical protein